MSFLSIFDVKIFYVKANKIDFKLDLFVEIIAKITKITLFVDTKKK